MRTLQTRSLKPAEVEQNWIVIDADGVVVGRLASFVAMRLRGKHRPDFTPHVDSGDHVIVVNAEKVALTGRKREDKIYYRHTGYAGGVKTEKAGKILDGRFPERVLEKAVERMLPKESPLARGQFAKLRVYAGPKHPHEAQQPKTIDFKARSAKNARTK